jgi:uncharacterized membrane protein HdeD (DUF308 family)
MLDWGVKESVMLESAVDQVSSRWWVLLVRGLVAIIFGIVAFGMPGLTLMSLVLLFGIYALVDGVFALVLGLSGHGGDRWWALLLEGTAGILIALFIWTQPVMSVVVFIDFIAAWAVFTGVMAIVAGIQFHDVIHNEWFYVIGGLISVIFGFVVLRNPLEGGIAEAWLIGTYAVLFGIVEVALSMRLRTLHGTVHAVKA